MDRTSWRQGHARSGHRDGPSQALSGFEILSADIIRVGRDSQGIDEIEGAPGELIDRLVAVMNSDELGELGWYSVGFYEYFVGAQAALAIDATSALGPADRRDPAGRRFREMALAATS